MKTHKRPNEKNIIVANREKKDGCKCNMNCNCCEEKAKAKKDGNLRTVIVTTILTLMAANVFAQDQAAQPSFWTDPFNSPMLPLYVTLTFVAITIILLVVVIIYVMKVLNFFLHQAEVDRAARLGIPVKVRQSWWQKLWQQANDFVPVEQEGNIDTGHDYDGIRELDNHLPPWWKGLFYATIVWGFVYLVVYHVSDSLPLSLDEYHNELAKADENARILKASRPAEVIDENTLEYTADAELIAKGKVVFASNNCASCHRADGGGNTIGPNLTDAYWLHGGTIKNIYATINAGFVEKGMPAWGKVMSAADVRNVAFYVMSLQGSEPKDAKAPQGELQKPADVVAPADSTIAVNQ